MGAAKDAPAGFLQPPTLLQPEKRVQWCPAFGISLTCSKTVNTKYYLICCAIVMIVLLRIGIGWHFLYEGIHKFDPASDFSAEGFLGLAKGPTAELYYWTLPDIDGVQRLQRGVVEDENGRERKTFIAYETAWKEYFKRYLATYFSSVSEEDAAAIADMNMAKLGEWLKQKELLSEEDAENVVRMNVAQRSEWIRARDGSDEVLNEAKAIVGAKTIFERYIGSLRADADEEDEIDAFKASRERFLQYRSTIRNNASFEQERRWRMMMSYRAEAAYWTARFDRLSDALQSDLGRLIDPQLAGRGGQIVTAPERELFPPNPFIQMEVPEIPVIRIPYLNADVSIQSRMDVMNWGVTFALTAIGLCLVLGFCTRLACLAGAAFLVNVVLTTYPVPGVYPAIPSVIGNFMFVSKDMIELIALLVLALVPAGRWGGLDYFLWNYGGKQFVGLFYRCPCAKGEPQ